MITFTDGSCETRLCGLLSPLHRGSAMAYELDYPIVSNAQENERASFIRRTYAHLAGAVLAFTALEFLIFNALPAEFGESMLRFVSNPVSALILIAAFIGVGYL